MVHLLQSMNLHWHIVIVINLHPWGPPIYLPVLGPHRYTRITSVCWRELELVCVSWNWKLPEGHSTFSEVSPAYSFSSSSVLQHIFTAPEYSSFPLSCFRLPYYISFCLLWRSGTSSYSYLYVLQHLHLYGVNDLNECALKQNEIPNDMSGDVIIISLH